MQFSRLGNLLLALVCIAGVTGQWGEGVSSAWWRYGAALVVAGLIYEWLAVRSTPLKAGVPPAIDLRLGRQEAVALQFQNDASGACELEYLPGLPADITAQAQSRRLRLGPGQRATETLLITARDIGQRQWERLPARMRGPLGLAWWSLRLPLAASVTIVPDLLGLGRRVEGSRPYGDRTGQAGSGMELHHLREYVPSDPLHTIHWKATARSNRLITRVMSEEQQLQIMLVLDIGRTSRTRVEGMSQFGHYINLAATFAHFALAHGDAVGLVAAADRPVLALPPRAGPRAAGYIHRGLRTLQPVPAEVDMLAAALAVQRLAPTRSLVILVTDLYSQVLAGSFGRSLKLWGTRHLPLVVGLVGDDVAALRAREAASDSDAYLSLAAAEYRGTLEANGEAARRLGARAAIARPADLQACVIEEYCRLKARRGV